MLIAATVIYFVLAAINVALVFMHSGRGTGLSTSAREAIGGAAAAVAERNVNILTAVAAAAFVADLVWLSTLL